MKIRLRKKRKRTVFESETFDNKVLENKFCDEEKKIVCVACSWTNQIKHTLEEKSEAPGELFYGYYCPRCDDLLVFSWIELHGMIREAI
jgi:hypothetical protein